MYSNFDRNLRNEESHNRSSFHTGRESNSCSSQFFLLDQELFLYLLWLNFYELSRLLFFQLSLNLQSPKETVCLNEQKRIFLYYVIGEKKLVIMMKGWLFIACVFPFWPFGNDQHRRDCSRVQLRLTHENEVFKLNWFNFATI